MKRQIRRGVFETNSSSVHSITLCSQDEYAKWERGEVLFWKDQDKFGTKEDIISELKTKKYYSGELIYPDTDWNDEDTIYDIFSDEEIQTEGQFWDNVDYCETFSDAYVTKSGEVVKAFGYYGHD